MCDPHTIRLCYSNKQLTYPGNIIITVSSILHITTVPVKALEATFAFIMQRVLQAAKLIVQLGLNSTFSTPTRIWTDRLIIAAHSQLIVKQVSPFFLLEIF